VNAPGAHALAERFGTLVNVVNQLIADVESDIATPSEAAFHAKNAFAALRNAHNALLDDIANRARPHYEAMAREAERVLA
jgi:hypothetical protein